MKFPFNWYNKFGTIPSSYREAMSYEEQILWLCQQIENLKIESGNFNYNMLENKPSINGVTLQGNVTATQLGLDNYNYLLNKPAINGITLTGNKSLTELDIQGKLTAGTGIRIVGNTISATGGGTGGSDNYNDLYNKPSINGIVLAGNLKGREAKLQDSLIVDKSSEINNNYGKIANLASYQINDTIPINIPEANYNDASYIILNAPEGSYFEITGTFDLYKIDNSNKLKNIYSFTELGTNDYESITDGTIVINFFDVGTYTAELKVYPSGKSFSQKFVEEDKSINTCKYNLKKFLEENYDYDNLLTNAQEGYYTGMENNDQLPELTEGSSYKYIKIPLLQNYSNVFLVNGECDSYLWFTTKVVNNTEYVTSHSSLNIKTNGTIYISADIPEEANYLYFQFSNYNSLSNVLEGLKITEISGGSGSINEYSSVLTLLPNTTPTLATGLYVLTGGQSGIYIGSASPNNLVFGTGEIFYYDSTDTIFYGEFNNVSLVEGTWGVAQSERIENVLTNNRNKIPTSQAVYNAIAGLSGAFYTNIDDDIYFNLDGTINLFDSSTPMLTTSGYYMFNHSVYYYDLNGLGTAVALEGAICYYDASTKELSITGTQKEGLKVYNCILKYVDSTDGWSYDYDYFNQILDEARIETSISSSSSNTKVAGAKAVYDALRSTAPVGVLSNDIVLVTNTVPAIDSGVYAITNNSNIYMGSASPSNIVFGNGEIVYYDAVGHAFYGSFIEVVCDSETGIWSIGQNDKLDVSTLSNSRNKFPTSLAVYNAILNRNTYSSTEHKIGVWTNGKPLYRIILSDTFPQVVTDGTQVGTYQDLSSLSISTAMIEWSGTFDSAQTAFQQFPLIRKTGGGVTEFIARVLYSDNKLYCYNNLTSYNSNTWICSLLYTKTTD